MADHNGELPYWLALRRAGLGSTNFALLLARFGSISNAWHCSPEQLAAAGVDRRYAEAVARARANFSPERELEPIEKLGLRVYTWLDSDFPEPLRTIDQAPPVLFVRGKLGPTYDPALAVVGTRNVTPYGRQATEHFVRALAHAGVAIISGLARGVDAVAHRVAVEEGVPTVAVMAGGIDQVYPRENQGLAARIEEHGCLVSEYPPGIPARPDYFPRRNRILSGLARATLVVEAGEGSGALHTANWAFEQGRDVFAIPGSIFSRQSLGTNQLIREHTAKLVATPEQLCEELNVLAATKQFPLRAATPGDDQPQTKVNDPPAKTATVPEAASDHPLLRLMATGPQHVDELARASGRPVHELSAELQLLALQGKVTETGPMTYAKG